jgi:hypothetical protein
MPRTKKILHAHVSETVTKPGQIFRFRKVHAHGDSIALKPRTIISRARTATEPQRIKITVELLDK